MKQQCLASQHYIRQCTVLTGSVHASRKHGITPTIKSREFMNNYIQFDSANYAKVLLIIRDVMDSKSASKSDGIRHFSQNPKSVGYLKSDRNGFKIFI